MHGMGAALPWAVPLNMLFAAWAYSAVWAPPSATVQAAIGSQLGRVLRLLARSLPQPLVSLFGVYDPASAQQRLLQANAGWALVGLLIALAAVALYTLGSLLLPLAVAVRVAARGGGGTGEELENPPLEVGISTGQLVGPATYSMAENPLYAQA